MLSNIKKLIKSRSEKTGFRNVLDDIGAPAASSELSPYGPLLDSLDTASANALRAFYRQNRSFKFSFEHAEGIKVRFGGANLFDLRSVLGGLKALPTDFVPFDRAPDDNVVAVTLRNGKVALFYNEAGTMEFVPMQVDLAEYLRLLDECRGLLSWQVAVMHRAQGISSKVRDTLVEDLRDLFPDADYRLF